MKTTILKPFGGGLLALAVALATQSAQAASEAEKIIQDNCLACHSEQGESQWSRISHQRKTPEGWLMTIARMQVMHGLKISDEDRRTLVKYLADRQGLAPSETEGARYALERRLNTSESFDSQNFTEMCARCHSGARVMLQRRPASEWEHLVHFHLGQWPTTEFQALARDRDWLDLALNKMVPELAETLPMDSAAWEQWQQQAEAPVAGEWTLAGHMPGKGAFNARMSVTSAQGEDEYSLTLTGQYADGSALKGKGQAVVYTGYEWRANVEIDGQVMRQVFALKEGQLSGRMFLRDKDEVGADVVAARDAAGVSHILALQPAYIKAGSEADITIVGSGLSGLPVLGKGVDVIEVISESSSLIKVRARAAGDASGVMTPSVGSTEGGRFAVYDRIASVKVVPEFAVARVGGNGGSTPKVEARFEAEAWAAGADGKSGTADDYRIGMVPATWSVAPFDEVAEADRDVHFSGRMNSATGVFTPAAAGPNPERRMMTNNAGNLKVQATVQDGADTHSAEGQMIVTVQRWNNPPIP
ncbi:quinohemoprotein amine dehydrogenase subunit alpha [Marinobacterium sediminicola]|uniref:Quinohemoprotein amine dehydrogenase n=1 Tax=Marinobacterium sediminicola TaxID=518898 RepID=A0ABY1RYQ0_9GAMM|nr:quinohemoprotein amine dehydrogenase subunit alpha [Marinobacterium sediminicola]ULG68041.1 quinohemoprotein amine dehydrogenase subunit alpha [Marinobacterium sediminicola]SMR73449.1 quinohemoprotein amine dehydrogenase [Marinobacterium sediminicola]